MSDTTHETQWYIAREGQQHGPLTDPEMQLFVTGGHLKPTDLLWRPGFADWLPALKVFPPPDPKSDEPKATEPATATTAKQTGKPASKTKNLSSRIPTSPHQGSTPKSEHAGGTSKPGDTTSQNPLLEPGPHTQSSSAPTAASPLFPSGPSRRQSGGLPGQIHPHGQHLQSGGTAGPSAQRPATGPHDPSRTSPTPNEQAMADVSGYGAPPRNRGSLAARLFTTIAAIAFVGGGGYFAYANRVHLTDIAQSMMTSGSGNAAATPPPVVKAKKDAKTAPALPRVATVTPAPAATDETIARLDQQFQNSPLWSLLKSEYPQWYDARLRQVISMNAAGDDPEVTKRLLAEIVALRRKHAAHALAASADKLRGVAAAFLANLKRLAEYSPDACSTFISNGELSPAVLNLMAKKEFVTTLETQATTIFQAISEGRRSPVTRERAGKQDYNVLTRQLGKMGWTTLDFQVFADRNALANAPAARKCQMLQDWFGAHIAIADASVQERLLFDTLRPVVAE